MLRPAIIVSIALGLAAALPGAIAQQAMRGPENAPEVRMAGDIVSIPFVVMREFPFVEAEVNGVKGKLMLDTGALDALSLNHNHLDLPKGRVIGKSNFASGQTFEIILRPDVDQVRLAGGLTYHHVTNVVSQDATQLEHITPDFLGWLGHGFWAGHAAKFDYGASKVTFYKGGPEVFLQGETVIAAIPFELRNRPNIPVLTARIGDTAFQVVLDTGQYGNIFADADTLEHLSSIGAISHAKPEASADIAAVRFTAGPDVSLAQLETYPAGDAAAFSKAVGITSPHLMMLGYAFLKQYKTVWDYQNRTLYLLKQ